jgi:hypothetical protein
VASRVSHGGTAPKNVRREADRWLKRLAKEPTRELGKDGAGKPAQKRAKARR